MDLNAKIYVAGHRGMVGSAVVRTLRAGGYTNIVARTHAELDLTDAQATRSFFNVERPDYVFLAAARVGGIMANNTFPADFILQNIAIETNVIRESHLIGVERLLFFGSSCIYPRDCPQPIREDYLLTGPLEPTNRAYAIAKIAGIEMCWAFNRQYGTRYLAAMPSNLYGLGDNYDLEQSHVLPALMRKMHEAKLRGAEEVAVWGTGKPRREFLFCDDLARAALLLITLPDDTLAKFLAHDRPPLVNVGYGEDLTVTELAQAIAKTVGFTGRLTFDISKPDGTPRKVVDISRIKKLGWSPHTTLAEGLAKTYADFQNTMSR
jgi:GDP-L-fucose synthase